MDFGHSNSTQLTERIMARIAEYLKPTPDHGMTTPHYYNRTYEAIHAVLREEFSLPVLPEFQGRRDESR